MTIYKRITIGEQTGISHCMTDSNPSVCSCGWTGTYDAATEHLYGDLTGAARRFAENPGPIERRG